MSNSGNYLVDKHEEEENKPLGMDYCFECLREHCICEELKAKHQEELEAYCQTFEDFLIDKHSEEIKGTEDDCLDDDLPDAFENWYGMQDAETIAEYAEEYGKACFRVGQKVGK
jgi:hypothetical protein